MTVLSVEKEVTLSVISPRAGERKNKTKHTPPLAKETNPPAKYKDPIWGPGLCPLSTERNRREKQKSPSFKQLLHKHILPVTKSEAT